MKRFQLPDVSRFFKPAHAKKAITPWPMGANVVKISVPHRFPTYTLQKWLEKGEYFLIRMAWNANPVFVIQEINFQISERRLTELAGSGHIEVLGSISQDELLEMAKLSRGSYGEDDGWRIEGGRLWFPTPSGLNAIDLESDESGWVRVNGHVWWVDAQDED